ncbi:MAG: DUF6515 family protein [Candidatus Omnitrophica bacterium]|nr:DUF6515 family protein [Candidatus Omnitrophota bacterium]
MGTAKQKITTAISVLTLVLAFCVTTGGEAFARHTEWRAPAFYYNAQYYSHLPHGHRPCWVNGVKYFYYSGRFFQSTAFGYVMVPPPVHAVVEAIPVGYQTIIYDNTPYYYYDRTYYVKQPTGYQVVNPPPAVVTLNPTAVEVPEKSVVVNVPNPNGSYIPVVLQKYSNGYVGPQGEFYPDYPSIDQLKAMYAKTSRKAESPAAQEEIVLNVPNANGSYTPVTLVKSEKGYIGPQGEYYPDKPTIDQLKVLYSKG